MKEPIIIIIVILILVGFAYGSNKDGVVRGKSTTSSSAIGTTNKSSDSSEDKSITDKIKEAARALRILEEDIDEKIEESKRSPYYDKIRLSRISGLHQNNPSKEYIKLSTRLDEGETVNITGWYLKSDVTSYGVVIGQAALLPFPFTRTESNVILKEGDKAYLTKGFSPIGISFRTNKCTGFFEENRTFYPSLAKKCPRPKDEILPTFSSNLDREEECLDLIDRIPRCVTRGTEFTRDLPDTVTQSCKTYITEQINYNFCVARHIDDIDFPGNEYRIYLQKFGPLWRERSDTIHLYDHNNLIVDTIKY